MDRIKRLSYEVLNGHKSKFGEDFVDNKKALNEISIIRSKSLKNKIAGYITKFIKKEIREEKSKQARIESSKSEQQIEDQVDVESSQSVISEEEILDVTIETTSEDNVSDVTIETTSEDNVSDVTIETTSEEEKTE